MTARERGSATVWMVGAIALTILVTGAALSVGSAISTRHRAAAAADEAALAVAAAAIQGPPAACAIGARIAAANGARLTRCRLADAIATVEVQAAMPGGLRRFGSASVAARAGPVSVSTPGLG